MARPRTTIVITSINPPTKAVEALAAGGRSAGMDLIVVGDVKSPPAYGLEGVSFLSIEEQLHSPNELARLSPTGHYARKNLGYLAAIAHGAEVIIDTDDDNLPRPEFFDVPQRFRPASLVEAPGWVNVYAYFVADSTVIWPRGLPLDAVNKPVAPITDTLISGLDCPIQQGLADVDPDVDAVYRLVSSLPFEFARRDPVALANGSWCPFNSQNTAWFKDAFALLYLPSYCSFRMTDIWRSFVAQRIAWANGWNILFHSATVWQERNTHDLMKDFADEVPGYLHNRSIARSLNDLEIRPGAEHIGEGLVKSYDLLIDMGLVGAAEAPLLEAWLTDFSQALS